MRSSNRRHFLKTTSLSAAAIGFPTIIPSTALGNAEVPPPSERIVVAGIGIGKQGRGDMVSFLNDRNVQYVAVCDVRKSARAEAKRKVDYHLKNKNCQEYNDYREVLARTDIDAVHIASPDHWHAQMTIDACRAGKDVYCQKPETRTLREGKLVVDAARRYGRVVSGGSQRVFQDYRALVRQCWSGELGPIKSINVNVGPLPLQCNLPEEPVPDDIDWDLWLGPAPWAPYNAGRCSGSYACNGNSWRSYVDYSSGGLTDWGAHHFGGATYAAGLMHLQPNEVVYQEERGQRFLSLRYSSGVTLTHNCPGRENMQVEGTPGETVESKTPPGYAVKGGIFADFIHCVKTRGTPFRDIEVAVNTAIISHLALVAYTLKRSLKWDAQRQCFLGDDHANRFLDYARRGPWQL